MDLIFLRHAKAENRLPELDDEDRELTPAGKKQAHAVAKGLNLYLRKAGKVEIWSSPARRSQQTAAILAKVLANTGLKELPALYSGCLEELATECRGCVADAVVIVGHEPYLSIWTRQMAGVSLPFKKCAAAGFEFQSPDTAVLKWFASPKVLATLGKK